MVSLSFFSVVWKYEGHASVQNGLSILNRGLTFAFLGAFYGFVPFWASALVAITASVSSCLCVGLGF